MAVRVHEAESAVSQAMVDGSIDHPRLASTIRDIDQGAYDQQIQLIQSAINTTPDATLSEALMTALTAVVAQAGIPVAMTQIICMAFYRRTWKLIARIDPTVTLDVIRGLRVDQAIGLMRGFTFGNHAPLPLPESMRQACHKRLTHMLFPASADSSYVWPLETLEREPWLIVYDDQADVIQNGIHNTVMRDFFIRYLGPDHLDDRERHAHHLVIDMLEDAMVYPQLHGFVQGVTPTQRQFRIAQIAKSLVAVHDMATRVAAHRAALSSEHEHLTITRQVKALQQQNLLAVAPVRHLLISCCYATFGSLVDWIHAHVNQLRIPQVTGYATAIAGSKTTRIMTPVTTQVSPQSQPAVHALAPAPGESPFDWKADAAPPAQRDVGSMSGQRVSRRISTSTESEHRSTAALAALVRKTASGRISAMKADTDVVEMSL